MKNLIWILLIFTSTAWTQTLTMTAPTSTTVTATVGSPLSFTCQVSAPPAGRTWAQGFIFHYSSNGGDQSVGTFTLPTGFATAGGTVTTNATFSQHPTGQYSTVRCLFRTDWNQTYQSPHKDLILNAGTTDTQAPSVPGGLTSSGIQSTQVTLSWSASTDNIGVTRYQVQTNSTGTPVDVTGATSRTMTGLTASTAYQFRVRACDAANNCSAYSNNVSVTTSAPSAGGTPNTATMISPSGSSFTATVGVAFNVSCEAFPPTGRVLAQVNLRHFRDGVDAIVGSATINSSNQNGGTFNFTATIPALPADGAMDSLRCWTATDWNQHNQSNSIAVNVVAPSDSQAPSIPTGLAVSGSTFNSVNLVWNAASDNVGVSRYEIQRSSPSPVASVLTVNAPGLAGSVTGLTGSTAYQFNIRACDAANNCSAYSSNVSVTTPAQPVDTQAPSVPSSLASAGVTNSTVSLSWSASTDNIGVTGYQVSINNGTPVDTTGTTYTASGLTANTQYGFRVRARDAAGNFSAYTSTLNVSTSSSSGACVATVPTQSATATYNTIVSVHAEPVANGIKLCWDQRSGTATIFRKTLAQTSFTQLGTSSNFTYTDSTAVAGQIYEYRVSRGSANGYVASGFNVPATDFQGKIILAVEQQLDSLLDSLLDQLELDLQADGWLPMRILIDRNTTASNARTLIQNEWNKDQTNTKALYLIGRIPLNTEAGLNPDGHGELGTRQWLADNYYSVMSGTHRLQVGRVDFEGMNTFPQSLYTLYAQYFSKVRDFKTKVFVPSHRGFFVDKLTQYNLASNFYLSAPGIVRSDIDNKSNFTSDFVGQLNSSGSFLFANITNYGNYSSGPNGLEWNGLNQAVTADYVTYTPDAIFNMYTGSYVCNGNSNNSFMRAPLASAGYSLASFCGSFINMFFHQLGMGQTIGHSMLESWKNYLASSPAYTPKTATTFGTAGLGIMNLQGDPTLRLKYVQPASNLQILNNAGKFRFTWNAPSGETVLGYNIYEVTSASIVKLNTSLLTGTSWNSTIDFATGRKIMIRAVVLEGSAGGNYQNSSLGVFGTY